MPPTTQNPRRRGGRAYRRRIPMLALTAQYLRRPGGLRRRVLTECPAQSATPHFLRRPAQANPSLTEGVAVVLAPGVRERKRGNFEKPPVSSMEIGIIKKARKIEFRSDERSLQVDLGPGLRR